MGSEQESPEGKEEHKSDVIVEPEEIAFGPSSCWSSGPHIPIKVNCTNEEAS